MQVCKENNAPTLYIPRGTVEAKESTLATNQSPLVIGVFQREAQARASIEALRAAGFNQDQIGIAMQNSGIDARNFLNDLMDLGVSRESASYYNDEYKSGRAVVSVRPDGRDSEARNILQSNGAYDYTTRASRTSGADTMASDRTTTTSQAGTMATGTDAMTTGTRSTDTNQQGTYGSRSGTTMPESDEQRSLRLREEQLQVEKQRVQSGEVDIRKEVVTEQKTINVPVSREEVVVERHAVTSGQVSDASIGQDDVIRVPITEEQVQVTKTPVVTGEVSVEKRTVEEMQQVSDTVRREEARVDREGNAIVRDDSTITRDDDRDMPPGTDITRDRR